MNSNKNKKEKGIKNMVDKKKKEPSKEKKMNNRVSRNTDATKKSLGIYLLPKLKEADKELFDFLSYKDDRGRDASYEKMCQSSYMPFVSDKKFTKTAVEQSFEYRGKFYACPEAICPEEGTAVSLKNLDIIEKETPNGPVRTALCPSCAKKNKEVYLLIMGEGSIYPGFLDPKRHPNGFCLPCCFKTDSMNESKPHYAKIEKCLSGKVKEVKNKKVKN